MTQAQPHTKPNPVFDVKNQLDKIVPLVLDDETLIAVLDCKGVGTGFVGLTDQRVIFLDQEILTIGKHKSMVSIPYNQVIGIAVADDGVVFRTSTIILMTAAGRFTFEFRGAERATQVYKYIMQQILNQAHPQLKG